MNPLLGDCRYALRIYLRTPVSTLAVVLVLSVGVAVFGSFLSLYVDLGRPHPGFESSRQLPTIQRSNGNVFYGIAFELVERMAEELTTIDAAATTTGTYVLTGEERDRVFAEFVSAQFFAELRPRVALGRSLRAVDHLPDAEPVVVISHRLWHERFGGDPSVLGATLTVARDPQSFYRGLPSQLEQEATEFKIVGVMSEALLGLNSSGSMLWMPLERVQPLFVGDRQQLPKLEGRTFVRRRVGVSAAAVEKELGTRYGDRLARYQYPEHEVTCSSGN